MSIEVKIETVDNSNSHFFRFASIKIGSGPYIPFFPTINSKLRLHEEKIHDFPKNKLVECHIKVTKQKLDEMDSDREKQIKFIKDNFARVYGEHLLIIPKVLLREGETLTQTEIRYLVDLLGFPGNIIYVAPLFYYYDITGMGNISVKDPVKSDLFFQLTDNFLRELNKDSVNTVGLMVPAGVAHKEVSNLLNLYKDFSTPITIVDFYGRATLDTYVILKPLLSESEYNLRQKQDEKYILYSFDSKPYYGRGNLRAAINILRYDMGFSSFGPRHTNRYNAKNRPQPPPGQEEVSIPKIFYKDHYSYSYPDLEEPRSDFLGWLQSNQIQVPNDNQAYANLVKKYHKDYEYENFINSVSKMKEAASENKLDSLLGNINELNKVMKKIKKNNREIGHQVIKLLQ